MSDNEKVGLEAAQELMDEGAEAGVLEAAANREDVTPDSLRLLLGEEYKDLNDDELMELYKAVAPDAGEEQPSADKQPDGEQPAEEQPAEEEQKEEKKEEEEVFEWSEPYRVLKADGTEAPTDLLKQATDLRFKFKSGGQEIEATLPQLVRAHQKRADDANRINTLLDQRNHRDLEFQQVQTELGKLREEQKYWAWVMADRSGQRFLDAVKKLDEMGPDSEEGPSVQPIGWTPEQQQQGELVFQQQFRPLLEQLATSYSPDGQTVNQELATNLYQDLELAFRTLVNAEGVRIADPTYGPQRLREIITRDLPDMVEDAGWKPLANRQQTMAMPQPSPVSGPVRSPSALNQPISTNPLESRVKELEKELAKARLRDKLKSAPDSGGGGRRSSPPSGSHVGMEKINSVADAKRLLEDPDFNFGM